MLPMNKDGRSLTHELLEGFRFAAIKLRAKGMPVKDIAQSFGVRPEAVSRWFGKLQQGGRNALRARRATGRTPFLDAEQLAKTIRVLRRSATEAGYATDLWSGPRLRHWIKREFKIPYHPKHMARLLKRLGLRLKFPERRALEQDLAAVREWKRRRLPQIEADANKSKALVFYADESLISLIPHIGKTWAFPKAKPIARVSGRRGQHIGVTAAVNRQGRMCFEITREKEKFTMVTFIRFIRKLHREHPDRKIILIVDGAPIHKGGLVRAFAESNHAWLRIEILPAYSPELNPTEKCWGFIKSKSLNGTAMPDKKVLRTKAKQAMQKVRKSKERVASFF